MRTPSLLLALLAIAAIALLVWSLTGRTDVAPTQPRAAAADDGSTKDEKAAARRQPAERVPVSAAADTAIAAGAQQKTLPHYPIERACVRVTGRVVDGTEQPVPGAVVSLQPDLGGSHTLQPIAEQRTAPPPAFTDAWGEFAFDMVEIGPWQVSARSADGRLAHRGVAIYGDDEPIELRLDAAPAADLRVRVVDRGGAAVAGAAVRLRVLRADQGIVPTDGAPDREGVTGDDGQCAFDVTPTQAMLLVARAERRTGQVVLETLPPGEARDVVTLTVDEPGSLAGTLRGVDAALLQGAQVQALALRYPQQAYYTGLGSSRTASVDGDRFAFAELPAGTYALHLLSPRGLRFALPPLANVGNAIAPLVVEVEPGEATAIEAEVAAGGVLEGTVRDDAGAPVVGALLATVLTPASSNFVDGNEVAGAVVWRLDQPGSAAHVHPAAHQSARTDAAGRYRLDALPPGRHRVEVFADGLEFAQRCGVEVAPGTPVVLDFELGAAGVLQGQRPGGGQLGVRRRGTSTCSQMAYLPDSGAFTFVGLRAGDYELVCQDPRSACVVLAQARVDAGRTTWIDLRRAGAVRIAGVLRDANGEPVDAFVQIWSARQRTRPDGSFELHLPWLLRYGTFHRLRVDVDGQRWLDLPEEAFDVLDWRGEFRIGVERLTVRVVDAGGAPLAGTLLVSRGDDQRGRTRIGADGIAEIRYLLPGMYAVSAMVTGAIIPGITVQVPASAPVQLVAAASTVLDVLALDEDGKPRAGAPVQIVHWRGDTAPSGDPMPWQGGGMTGADGHAHIVVPVGDLRVHTLVWDTERSATEVVRAVRGVPVQVTLQLGRTR